MESDDAAAAHAGVPTKGIADENRAAGHLPTNAAVDSATLAIASISLSEALLLSYSLDLH